MSKLIPDYVFDSIYDITPEVLTAHGVRGVLVDLDGTMASHKAALPPETLYTFVDRLKNAGIAVLVFSNNHPERVGKFCEPLGVGYISHAGKPFSRGFRKAANRLGLSMREIAVIGDQIFTDVFGGNRAGALTLRHVAKRCRPVFLDQCAHQSSAALSRADGAEWRREHIMAEPKFGPAGNSESFAAAGFKKSEDAPCMARTDGTDRV